MASKKASTNEFGVTGRIHIDICLNIEATDISEAIVKAKTLQLSDFLEVHGDIHDEKGVEIVSIWSEESL